jgi:hypothetical protein
VTALPRDHVTLAGPVVPAAVGSAVWAGAGGAGVVPCGAGCLDLGTTDLTALAITERPRPTRDLLTGEPGPTIDADTLDVDLPGHGSAFLAIQPPP